MLISNVLRYGTDTFTLDRQGLLTSKTALDATAVTSVTGFTITGAQPDNTDRRVVFKVDDDIYKFDGSDLVRLSGDPTFDNIIANGNTVAELAALTNIPDFVGKKIYPIIALKATSDASDMPTIKLAINGVINSQQLTKTVETAETILTGTDGITPQIVSISADATCSDSRTSVTVTAALKTGDTWGEFISLNDAAGQAADAVKFSIVYAVPSLAAVHTAKLNSITIRHTLGETVIVGETAEIISTVQNFEEDLQTCYLIVRHAPLFDSTIKAYVAFGSAPKQRTLVTLGTADGSANQQFNLPATDTGIDPNTLTVFVNGQLVNNFGYSTYYHHIVLTATSGAVVTASYDYGLSGETWLEMTRDIDQQPYPDGNRMTRFTYTLPDDETENRQISNIRIVMNRPVGSVKNLSLGNATGKTQMIVLPHYAEQSSIQFNADWSYNEDDKILTFVAPKGTALTISYDWRGEQITVYSWAAGWNAAI